MSKTSYCQIWWSLQTVRFYVIMIISLQNLTGNSAALLPRCLSNLRVTEKFKTQISQLQDLMSSCGKMSIHLVNRGPEEAFVQRVQLPVIWDIMTLMLLSLPLLKNVYNRNILSTIFAYFLGQLVSSQQYNIYLEHLNYFDINLSNSFSWPE